MCVSAKFGTCTVVSVNGTLVEDIMRRFKGECAHLASISVPFTLTTIFTHLALTHTKRITVFWFLLWLVMLLIDLQLLLMLVPIRWSLSSSARFMRC
jgi:hypothetical protein